MISCVDTHCHIDLDVFDEDRGEVLTRMHAAGVHAAMLIGYNPERWVTTSRLCNEMPFLRRSVGLHPNDASLWSDVLRDQLHAELSKGDALAVGEIGLDYFRDHAAPELQQAAFVGQIELAREFDLPIVIHQRSAERDVLDILSSYAPIRGIMHCFSGDATFAHECLRLGLEVGAGGVMTYPKSVDIRDALRTTPLDRIVLETDAPFLAPQAIRGKRNEPARVLDVAVCLADLHACSVEDVVTATTASAMRVFGRRLEHARRAGMRRVSCA